MIFNRYPWQICDTPLEYLFLSNNKGIIFLISLLTLAMQYKCNLHQINSSGITSLTVCNNSEQVGFIHWQTNKRQTKNKYPLPPKKNTTTTGKPIYIIKCSTVSSLHSLSCFPIRTSNTMGYGTLCLKPYTNFDPLIVRLSPLAVRTFLPWIPL